jgi:hypothetical protein
MRRHVLLTFLLASCPLLSLAQAARRPAARPSPAAKAPARDVEGEERARKLSEEMQSTAKLLQEANPAAGLSELAARSAPYWVGPFYQKMNACVPHWAAMSSAAGEGRPADLARAALEGHLVVDAIFAEVSAKSGEYDAKVMALVAKDKPDLKELERANHELQLATATMSYLGAALDTFDMALQVVAGNGPSEVQSALFEEVAGRLPEARQTRMRLETVLRTLHDRQRDPAARKEAAARLAALDVPLTLPSPSPSPPVQGSN